MSEQVKSVAAIALAVPASLRTKDILYALNAAYAAGKHAGWLEGFTKATWHAVTVQDAILDVFRGKKPPEAR
jgi:hypothetical protein